MKVLSNQRDQGMAPHAGTRRSRGWIWCLSAFMLACSSDEDPEVNLRLTHFDHISASTTKLHLPPDSLSVSDSINQITVQGSIRLPDHCDQLRAALESSGRELELRLQAATSHSHRECEGSDRTVIVGYAARLRNLPPGEYRLRVVYDSHAKAARSERDIESRRILYEKGVVVE